MDPAHFFAASRVLIVAGKGGVGKTTACATMARSAADAGCTTLLIRLTDSATVSHLFAAAPITIAGTELRAASGSSAAVRGQLVTSDDALMDYLHDHGLERLSRRLVSTGALDLVTTAAPGIRDLLVLGRVKQFEVAGAADLIILDAPAAGHAVSFLRAPAGLREAVNGGPIATQATDVLEMLADPGRCRVMLVTLAEETPVNELIETAFALEDEVGVQLGPVIVNGVLPPIGDLSGDVRSIAAEAGVTIADDLADGLTEAARFRSTWAARQRTQLDRLAEQLPLPRIELPLQFTTDLGPTELDRLSTAFTTAVHELSDEAIA